MEILHPYPRWEKINLAAMGLTAEIEQIINRSLNGADDDGNGSIGNTTEEFRLMQIRQRLEEMLAHKTRPISRLAAVTCWASSSCQVAAGSTHSNAQGERVIQGTKISLLE